MQKLIHGVPISVPIVGAPAPPEVGRVERSAGPQGGVGSEKEGEGVAMLLLLLMIP